ncbi:MAG: hypothetical protein LBG86_02275, partial [Puniceicoccales bacterium]|nr:hypothetical protein [Puniceicoccales bacterium]
MTNDSQISHCSIDGTEEIDAQTSFEKKDDSPIFIDDVAARQKERREARMRREQTEAEKLIAIDGEQKIRRPRGRPRLHPIGEKLERSNGMSEVMTQTLSSSEEERAFDGELHREPSIEREEVSNTRPYGHGNDCRPRLPRERQPRMGTSGQRNLHQNSPRNGNGNASLQQSQQRREPSPWNRQNGNGGSSTAIGGRRLPFGNLRDWDRLRSLQTLDLLSGEFFSDCLPLNFNELYALNGAQLQELATSMEEGDAIRSNQRKRILQHCFLRAQENRAPIAADGLLAFLPDGNGYLVYGNDNYQVS